ncbi:hypothetical protein, variant [Aphanomyces invadans]|uniref:C2 domain-containing protein n=1 Tax=Aphanomyces invadans TaxID=157072 RepID=A0A024UA02_9STRA|nr:hypothetical protein, variant [Aphanomyces invadans]ETW02722.1 hypothetical protein, variant [Aphanomyces invadans]|eukprot:XP_008869327.1 hypothetical protein, variant [Aphanomyces invadans]
MNFHDSVGCGVEVFCDSTKAWHQGKIVEYDAQVGYRVVYNDGNEQWEDLSDTERVHLVPTIEVLPSARPVDQSAPNVDGNNAPENKCMMNPPPELEENNLCVDVDVVDTNAEGTDLPVLGEVTANDLANDHEEIPDVCGGVASGSTSDTPHSLVGSAEDKMPSTATLHNDQCTVATTIKRATDDTYGPVQTPTQTQFAERDAQELIPSTQLSKPSDQLGKARLQFPPFLEWDGQASRLSGRIWHCRTEQEVTWRVFVKIYIVPPGPGSIQLRCKGAIHTTRTHECANGGPWFDSEWTYLFTDEPVNLDIEVLYAVYHAESTTNNIFLGQILISLRDLVGRENQSVYDNEYSLKSRQGKCVAGVYFHLEHQFLVTSFVTSTHEPTKVDSKANLPVAVQLAHDKPRLKPIVKERQREIARKATTTTRPKSSSSAPSRKHKQSLQTQEKIYKTARRMKTTSQAGNGKRSTYKTQVQLVEDIAELQSSVAQAEAQVMKLRMTLSRLEISQGKLRTTAECLKRSIARSSPLTVGTKSNNDSQGSTVAPCSRRTSESSDYLESLATVFSDAERTREQLLASIAALSREESVTDMALRDAMDDLQRGHERLQVVRGNSGAERDDDRFFSQRFNVLMGLRVDVTTLEEQKAMNESKASHSCHGGNALTEVEEKVLSRRKKEEHLQQEIALHRSQYEEIVQSNVVNNMKRQVKDLQWILLLTKRP